MLLQKFSQLVIEKFAQVRNKAQLVIEYGGLLRVKNALLMRALATTYGPGNTPTIAITTLTTSATLTAAQVISGLLLANQGAAGAATYTMPTGTLLQAALPKTMQVGDGFEFTIVNVSTVAAEDVTVAGGSGTTAVGNMTIASNAAVADQAWGTFYVQKTGNNAFSFYRVG